MNRRPFLKYIMLWVFSSLVPARFLYLWLTGIGEINEFSAVWRFYPQAYLLAWMVLNGTVTVAYLLFIKNRTTRSWQQILTEDMPILASSALLWFWTIADKLIFVRIGLAVAVLVLLLQIGWRWWRVLQTLERKNIFVYMTAILVLAAAVRILLLLTSNSVVGSEEAIMGLMARHLMLNGEFSVFLWGQPYMGSFEAIVAVVYFFLLGASSITLKLIPFTFSLGLVVMLYYLGRQVYSERTGLIAASIIAVGPAFLIFTSLFATAYMENLFFSGVIILLVFALLRQSRLNLWLVLGFISGLAFWNNTNSVFVLIQSAILAIYIGLRQRSYYYIFGSGLAALVGASPLLAFNIKHGWPTFKMLFGGVAGAGLAQMVSDNIVKLFGVTKVIFGFGAAGEPWQTIIMIIYIASAVYGIWIVAMMKKQDNVKRDYAIFLFFVLVVFIVLFTASKYGSLNEARYALVLYLVYPVFFAALAGRVADFSRIAAALIVMLALFVNLAGVKKEAERRPPETPALSVVLQTIGVDFIYTDFWTAYQLTFVSKEKVICRSAKPDVYPAYGELIKKASPSRVGVLFRINDVKEPGFIGELDRDGVEYEIQRFYGYDLISSFDPFSRFEEIIRRSQSDT